MARKRAARVAAVAFAASVLLIPGLAAAEEGGGGGGGEGGPTSLVFTLTWETNDGVVHDSMPAPALAGFGAVSFNAGGKEMGTATCTQVAGSAELTCSFENQGHGSLPGLVLPNEPEGDVHRDDDRRARRLDGGSDDRSGPSPVARPAREDGGHEGGEGGHETTTTTLEAAAPAAEGGGHEGGEGGEGRRRRRRRQGTQDLHPHRGADPGSGPQPPVVPTLDAAVEAAVVTAVPVATSPAVTG